MRELPLHVVERHRQLAQLVARVDRDWAVEVSRRDLLGGSLEPLDPLGQPPCHQISTGQRQQERDAPGYQDLVAHRGHVVDDVRDRRGVDDHPAQAGAQHRIGRFGHRARLL